MRYHFSRNYRIISVMFWSFPYLLWQAFGNWSGFLVGVIVAVVLTMMFNSLFRGSNWNTASTVGQQYVETAEPQPQRLDAEMYQRGYRGEAEAYREEPRVYQVEELQPQHEEMQVLYPEMPPMEQQRSGHTMN